MLTRLPIKDSRWRIVNAISAKRIANAPSEALLPSLRARLPSARTALAFISAYSRWRTAAFAEATRSARAMA